MDASSVPVKQGTDGAFISSSSLPSSLRTCSPLKFTALSKPHPTSRELSSDAPAKLPIAEAKATDVIVTYPKHNGQTKIHESNQQRCEINRQTSYDTNVANTNSALSNTTSRVTQELTNSNLQREHDKNLNSTFKASPRDPNQNNNEQHAVTDNNNHSLRSLSSPQLSMKPPTRSKVYRKASLKSLNKSSFSMENCTTNGIYCARAPLTRIVNVSNKSAAAKPDGQPSAISERSVENDSGAGKGKWNVEDVHITCNPLSTPYPYSTPCQKAESTANTEPPQPEDEPKGRSCGSFLPILALIPQTVISFQYLSPKMKFSWWRNKIS